MKRALFKVDRRTAKRLGFGLQWKTFESRAFLSDYDDIEHIGVRLHDLGPNPFARGAALEPWQRFRAREGKQHDRFQSLLAVMLTDRSSQAVLGVQEQNDGEIQPLACVVKTQRDFLSVVVQELPATSFCGIPGHKEIKARVLSAAHAPTKKQFAHASSPMAYWTADARKLTLGYPIKPNANWGN